MQHIAVVYFLYHVTFNQCVFPYLTFCHLLNQPFKKVQGTSSTWLSSVLLLLLVEYCGQQRHSRFKCCVVMQVATPLQKYKKGTYIVCCHPIPQLSQIHRCRVAGVFLNLSMPHNVIWCRDHVGTKRTKINRYLYDVKVTIPTSYLYSMLSYLLL